MPDVADILEEGLPPERLGLLRAAGVASSARGVGLYLVGGAVRDILMRQRPLDLDLAAVGATLGSVEALAADLGGRIAATSQFHTYKVEIKGTTVDLAMARRESYASPGALPTVEPGSIEQDLARRDFSINAAAVSLERGTWGRLLDPHRGQQDIADRQLRVLHGESFRDDATRILRAIRYSCRLGFRVEETTHQLMARDLPYLDTIGGDRVRHELQRIAEEDSATSMLGQAVRLDVMKAVYPSMDPEPGLMERLQAADLGTGPERGRLFFALLAYTVPSRSIEGLIARLGLSASMARVVRDVGVVRACLVGLREPQLRWSRVNLLMGPCDATAVRACAMAVDDPEVARRLETYLVEKRPVRTLLGGDDLIRLGVSRSPEVGRILDDLLAARLDGLLSSSQDEEAFVKDRLESTS